MAKGVYIGVEKKPTLMLLHGDDLTESANNLPVTNNSVTVVDDTGAFDGKALNFSGSGQYLSIADDTLNLPGDFTIDFRLYNAGSTSWRGIFETAGATSSNWTFHKGGLNISLGDGSNLLFAGIAKGGGTYSTLNTPANSVPVGTWSHIALVRSNGVMTFYINGVSSASLSDSEAVTTDGTILIGKHDIRDEMYLNGKIDEFRVSSVARWTSNFTPPTEAYPNDEAGVGIARKVKKMYYGVGNLAKEIKKGYIGIGGVARPFWTSGPGEPMYYGHIHIRNTDSTASPSSPAWNSEYAIFALGKDGNDNVSTMDAFSSDLILTSLYYPYAYDRAVSRSFRDYAMFAAATSYWTNPSEGWPVYCYGSDLVRVSRGDLLLSTTDNIWNYYLGAIAQINNNAIYVGGGYPGKGYSDIVVAFNESFIQQKIGNLSSRRVYMSGSQNSNYALFMGGGTSGNTASAYLLTTVDCFNSSFVRSSTNISVASLSGKGLSIGNYACRIGGYNGNNDLNSIEAFDENLIRSSPTSLDYETNAPYVGMFRGASFIKGTEKIIHIDDDFIKTTYNYIYDASGVESFPDDDNSEYGWYECIWEQTLVPVGDYLVWGRTMNNFGSKLVYHAFKFS